MKGIQRPTSIALANNHHEYTSPVKYAASRKHAAGRPLDDDEDWIMDTPKRRPPRGNSFSEKKNAQNAAVVENDVNRIIRSVAEETGTSQIISTPVKPDIQSPVKKPPPTPIPTIVTPVKSSVVVAAEAKPISNSANDGSPSKRLAQTKRETEKKKPLQVSQSKCVDLGSVLVAIFVFPFCCVGYIF